jgi:AmmeMemoRadiSam system protein A
MNLEPLSEPEKGLLLALARRSVEAAAAGLPLPEIARQDFSPRLFELRASFVTLTETDGALRGCIGALEAYLPLVEDVSEHAAAAAVQDYRFQPVRPADVAGLHIEISCLTEPRELVYENPEDLCGLLRPGIDGVTLREGRQRATFLPQVWETLPDPEKFLAHLCQKMGASSNLWRKKKLKVQVYQVEEFHESIND